MGYFANTAKWWKKIFSFEDTTPLKGGTVVMTVTGEDDIQIQDGFDNVPLFQLAERTEFLKNITDAHSLRISAANNLGVNALNTAQSAVLSANQANQTAQSAVQTAQAAQAANDVQDNRLAALETVETWTTIVASGAYGGGFLRCRKISKFGTNGLVCLNGLLVRANTGGSEDVFATVPVGYRPFQQMRFVVNQYDDPNSGGDSNSETVILVVGTNGEMRFFDTASQPITPGNSVRFTVFYFTD